MGFLGPRGSFGEQAALLRYAEHELEPFASHAAVIGAVAEGAVEAGVVAVENSTEGSVLETLDALLREERIWLQGEIVLPVDHHLIAAPGTRFEDVRVVMSHSNALGQCRLYLERHLPDARLEAALSTTAAVEAAVATPGAAGIGSSRAADLAGGEVLAERIQDTALNLTRFLVVARRDAPPQGDDKTSIAFTVAHDRPGTLMGVLKELAERQINMTHIESRPSRQGLGIYVFLIDFEGHRTAGGVADALRAIEAQASYFRVLGSYPRAASG